MTFELTIVTIETVSVFLSSRDKSRVIFTIPFIIPRGYSINSLFLFILLSSRFVQQVLEKGLHSICFWVIPERLEDSLREGVVVLVKSE